MARPAPTDDGSPTRIIATMVGIVGIVLLGSLAWSAVGAMFSAFGAATALLTTARPTQVGLAAAVTPATVVSTPQIVVVDNTSTPAGQAAARLPETPLPTLTSTPAPTQLALEATTEPALVATQTPNASGRAPWVLLPLPAPDGRVSPGSVTVEARARGDAPITAIRLELDGAALPVSLEQRGGDTWRGTANAQVAAGHHAVRATVVDDQGRSGSFRWTFDAQP